MLAVGAGKRVRLMQAARDALGLPAAVVLEWTAWLDRPDSLAPLLAQPCVFKIESPGDDPLLYFRLLQQGCVALGRDMPRQPEHGELSVSDAWFAGLSQAMQHLSVQLAQWPDVKVLNAPLELLRMTDKLACQQHLHARQVPIPRLLGMVDNYAHLRALLDEHALDQVFVKPRYGSSAAGVVAYRRNRRGAEQAVSTAHLVQDRLYNVKCPRRYGARGEIAQLIDLLAGQHAYVEAWLPKPRLGDGHYDLRVVTLAGEPAHRVARVGKQVMTNLHLDNRRADAGTLLSTGGKDALEHVARLAAAAFPHSHVIGLDMVVRKSEAHVLEANAFGDLLPGLLWGGLDTYGAQLRAFINLDGSTPS